MADEERSNQLQRLLRIYLDSHPGSERELADEFRTAVGTITRWANGHSRPAQRAEQAIIASLKSKIYAEFQNTLSTHLTDNLELVLATEFQVAISTVKRWANGTAHPHPRLAQVITTYVKSRNI